VYIAVNGTQSHSYKCTGDSFISREAKNKMHYSPKVSKVKIYIAHFQKDL